MAMHRDTCIHYTSYPFTEAPWQRFEVDSSITFILKQINLI